MAQVSPLLPATAPDAAARPHMVAVSNRLAPPGSTQTGGLATALQSMLADHGGDWVGWSGCIDDAAPTTQRHGGVGYHAVNLTEALHRDYYLGFANRCLWPLLHSRLDLLEYERTWYAACLEANARFATSVSALLQPESLLWVHDYHLLPLPRLLRESGVSQRIGFFLHTPFPAPDVFRSLPGHAEILSGLLGCDLVGVQTHRDAAHLVDCLRSLFPRAKLPAVRAFPIGVEPTEVAADAERPAGLAARRQLRESLAGRQLVMGVDRLDYSKGLPERFKAYGRMLEQHADLRRQVSYLQVAPVSRGEVAQYRDLKKRLDRLAGEVNGRHGDADWVPLRYISKALPHATISAYLREASVGLVTPLRDGMNLVAKEFVAAQSAHDPGVLVLSEFAGAAETMKAALLVNPYDACQVADTLALALRMPLRERRRRWEQLMGDVVDHGLGSWRRRFVDALAATGRHVVGQNPRRADQHGPTQWVAR